MTDDEKDDALLSQIIGDVILERMRQEKIWGPQSRPMGGANTIVYRLLADTHREACDLAAKAGTLTWRHVFLEEVYESFAEPEYPKFRAELIQALAVGFAILLDGDKRASPKAQA